MDTKVLLCVLALALLVVGCGGQAPSDDQPEGDQPEIDQEGQEETGQSGIDFSQYDSIADLKSLREGVVCEATHDAGFQGTWKLKDSKVHMTGTVNGTTAETVIKDNTLYMQVPEGQSGMDCVWMSMDLSTVDTQESEQQVPGEYKKPEDTSLIDYNCRQEDVPDSEFEVSGSVCDLSEMMQDMPEMPEDMPDY